MIKRSLAATALALGLLAASAGPVLAETASPTPAAVTPAAVPTAPTPAGEPADLAPDNSRQLWALSGAGALALVAAAVVFARRS